MLSEVHSHSPERAKRPSKNGGSPATVAPVHTRMRVGVSAIEVRLVLCLGIALFFVPVRAYAGPSAVELGF